MMQNQTLVDLLRHGEVLGGPCYRGQQDDPLTAKGLQQMADSIGEFRSWDVLVSSPLQRCLAFAEILQEKTALPIEVEPAFAEISFGDWEGCTADEIRARDEKLLTAYWENPQHVTPPHGESLTQFQQRVGAAWQALLEKYPGQHILLISHAGVMRVILSAVLQMPHNNLFKLDVPHACLSRIAIEHYGGENITQLKFHAGHIR